MSNTNRVAWETLRSIDSATLTGTYAAVGGPLLHPAYIVKMVSNSNVLVTVSIDGATDIDVLPAGSFWLYDEGKVYQMSAFPSVAEGTQFFVKGSAGTGLIYLVIQYIVSN